VAGVLFSTGGAAIKAATLTSWQIAGFRSAVGVLALLLFLPEGRRGWTGRAVLVGVAYAGTLICYALANTLTTAANTVFLQSTAPLYVALLAPWLLGERLRRPDVGFMVVMALGLAPFFLSSQTAVETAPDPVRGNLLGLGAGVFWALTVVGLRWLSRGRGAAANPVPAVVIGNLLAFLICLPMALPVREAEPSDWLVIVYLGAIQIGLAYVFMTRGLRVVPALEASLLVLVEVVLNPFWAWLLHAERPERWPLVGGAVILLAIAGKSLLESRSKS
jgi:drug/metabolite transporter (DMT)-like permease